MQREAEVVYADLTSLRQSPDNPRRISDRDFERLRRSIREDPDFMRLRPILARADGTVYAGNMRLEAARAEGWAKVPVIYTNDPEAVIKARAVKDNASFGEWVEDDLAEYLHGLVELDPDFNLDTLGLDAQMNAIVGAAPDLSQWDDMSATMPTDNRPDAVGGMGGADEKEPEPVASIVPDARTEASLTQLASLPFELEDCEPEFGIPLLDEHVLMPNLPDGLTTWAGPDTPPDPDAWWLYNYSPAGTWRDVPLDRAILSFFTDDRFLQRWTANPAYYISRAVKAGVRVAVELDLSPCAHPRVVGLLQTYRTRFVARLMQDVGIGIIPRWPYPVEPEPRPGYNADQLRGFPDHVPVLAFNAQSQFGAGHADELGSGFARWLSEGHTVGQVLVYGQTHWPEVARYVPDVEAVVLPTFLDRRKELGLPWRAN